MCQKDVSRSTSKYLLNFTFSSKIFTKSQNFVTIFSYIFSRRTRLSRFIQIARSRYVLIAKRFFCCYFKKMNFQNFVSLSGRKNKSLAASTSYHSMQTCFHIKFYKFKNFVWKCLKRIFQKFDSSKIINTNKTKKFNIRFHVLFVAKLAWSPHLQHSSFFNFHSIPLQNNVIFMILFCENYVQ